MVWTCKRCGKEYPEAPEACQCESGAGADIHSFFEGATGARVFIEEEMYYRIVRVLALRGIIEEYDDVEVHRTDGLRNTGYSLVREVGKGSSEGTGPPATIEIWLTSPEFEELQTFAKGR